ncbi:major royal jelly protein 1-like [Phymastichus coffea]|uniref:major royal jelly protein 1-like n=1 Tax=Phymastichus coffea TaxID=108790 RepID=UPI00273B8520|nr:major royal jelly protein 1-like [Phymastichus coffea]
MLILLALLELLKLALCYHPSSTRKPDFVITVPPQAVSISSNSYASSNYADNPCQINPNSYVQSTSTAQPPLANINGYSQVRRNDFPNVLSTDGPINQNSLVKPLLQAAKNNNRYASSTYVNSLKPQSISNAIDSSQNLPVNQNSLVNSLSRSFQLTSPSIPTNLPQSEASPIYQNALVKPLLEAKLSNADKFAYAYANPQLQGNNNSQLSVIEQNPIINTYTNQNQLIYSLPQNAPINQNPLVDSFPPRRPAFNNPIPPQNPQVIFPGFNNQRPQITGLEVAFQWQFLDWVHPTVQLTGKNFTVGNPLSQDVDIDNRGRVFVTSPQWLEGTPVTLSVITDLKGLGGPLLTPYPDWTWHRADCDSLVSVYRVAIDECNRLWMVDTGSASGQSVCPMKLLAFDLKTDQVLLKYIIPEDQTVSRKAQYVNPVVEVGDNCQDTYVYVADVIKHGLLVYSLRENRSWRLDNTPGNAFGNDPQAGRIVIAGEPIDLTDGTLGVALSPRGFYSKRYLYFNSLASFYQKFVDTDSLKRSLYTSPPLVYQSVARRVSQAGVHAISKTGAMFFQLAGYTALACWNIERPFLPENVVVLAQDPETLQYVSGIKVLTNASGEEEVWFNTNRLQKTINKSRNINDVNFRLIHGKVDDLIKGTRCQPTGYTQSQPNYNGWRLV